MKYIIFIGVLGFLSCGESNNVKISRHELTDSLYVFKNQFKPDFIILEPDDKDSSIFSDSSLIDNHEANVVKIYYDKGKNVRRIVIYDHNYVIHKHHDTADDSYAYIHYGNRKSTVIDFTDTFKKVKVQHSDAHSP